MRSVIPPSYKYAAWKLMLVNESTWAQEVHDKAYNNRNYMHCYTSVLITLIISYGIYDISASMISIMHHQLYSPKYHQLSENAHLNLQLQHMHTRQYIVWKANKSLYIIIQNVE